MCKYFLISLVSILITTSNIVHAETICENPPAGISDISGNSFYKDANYSEIDEALKKKNDEAVKPFGEFLRQVSKNSDLYIANNDKTAAKCSLEWLERWAKDDAMLGKTSSNQAEYERKWMLSGLALSYIKVKPEATKKQSVEIESWLKKMANISLEFANKDSLRNNHYYWVGLAMMATGVATDDKYYINEAKKIYDFALSEIRDDGSLPQELARGGKALSYHNYALAPLVIIAELSKAQDENWYKRKNRRLDRLAELTLKGISGDKFFAEANNSAQEIPHGGILGWIVFYQDHNREFNKAIQPLLTQQPFIYPQLGGDLSELYKQQFYEAFAHRAKY